MTNANASRGAREPHSLASSARRISTEHFSRLRQIVVGAGSVHAAFPLLKTSPDALTFKIFRGTTAAALEAKIDRLHRELEQGS